MPALETFFALLFAAVLLVGISQKLNIAYPIALVLGGTAISFIPGLPLFTIDPNVILVIVLPPVLHYASFGISSREFTQNWRNIFSLALGLVVATTIVVAILFKWMFPNYSWALAFAFGALISPPDAIAATSILKRFSINSRLLTLLEGESLVNDASALVLYKLAITALLSGTFSFMAGGIEFFQIVVGGIVVGFFLGFLLQQFSKEYLEPSLGAVFSITIPYIVYITANFLEASGVLAVVVSGLIGSRILRLHQSSLRRVVGYAFWDIFIILLNCVVFILIGLNLRTLSQALTPEETGLYALYAVIITLAMVAVRMLWVYTKSGIAYLKALGKPKSHTICPQILREAALVGWSGMRGIVSLAAALALPYNLPNGQPLEGRNEVLFITFLIILITLVIPGLTLAPLIRWLKIQSHPEHSCTAEIRQQLSKTAEDKLHHLFISQSITEPEHTFLKAYFSAQARVLELSHVENHQLHNIESARLAVIQAQRKRLLDLWMSHTIDDKLLTHLQGELDMVEVHVARAQIL